MDRTPLDLRHATMSELMEMDAEIGKKLDNWGSWNPLGGDAVFLLADRRQIRARMEELREPRHYTSVDDSMETRGTYDR
jgi:hypothetical protein